MAPTSAPKKARFAGEISYSGGADAFGCANELEWLFFRRDKYCHNGGTARVTRKRAPSVLGKPVCVRGQLRITVGDRLRRLRPPAHDDPVPVDRDVRVVTRCLGDLGQPVDEVDRRREVLEAELALQRPLDLGPALGHLHALTSASASVPLPNRRTSAPSPT